MTDRDPFVTAFIDFGVRLFHQSRFFSEPPKSILGLLALTTTELATHLPVNTQLFRARVHPSRAEPPSRPFSAKAMWNPPSELAKAGRLNAGGISRLYLASTVEAAAAEVRAVTGDHLTVAKFKSKRRLKTFDFRKMNLQVVTKAQPFLDYVGRLISSPVDSYDSYEMVLSQWFVEFLAARGGFHAIVYPSFARGEPRESAGLASRILGAPKVIETFNVCGLYPKYDWRMVQRSRRLETVQALKVEIRNLELMARLAALTNIVQSPEKLLNKLDKQDP